MDQNKAKVSIRLNGKRQPFQELVENNPASAAKKNDRSRKPREDADKVIDFHKRYEDRIRNEEPFWDDGNRKKSPKIPYKRKKKKPYGTNERFALKVKKVPVILIMALVSALIVGTSLGFIVLTIFTADELPVASGEVQETVPAVSQGDASFPELAVEVVQGGAFTSIEAGEAVIASLQEKGRAAALVESDDSVYMFIGLAQDRAKAQDVAQAYSELDQDTYIKSFAAPTSDSKRLNEETIQWLHDMESSYQQLVSLSVDGLTAGGARITKESVEGIRKEVERLHGQQKTAFQELDESTASHLQVINEHLIQAGNHLASYVSTQDGNALWKTQQELLDALVQYQLFSRETSRS
ncbi:hypothetical protein P4637_06530 [Halalkalibacterium halodurans]|uniref:Stage II sporulation protein B (Endospore development) n=1 Tax=Halalkalibacterium halodurans (strain ATCC BAA-125 / DSM 18197 / FERM 7344 / JCM 9153 / C-125) TaxID=272558 RepID=Q9K8H2_HALH5|nr:hypothetical protein [Halalkalibacterium halodurans]MED4082213.1 hypothetical protein [Halalkalibacterium halodurans]MED4084520.1 hypothetical protein [Halalkalibacterium halodurans]MED4103714.1 hypothetical protein [Halalkalibacterium halodurans]MED4110182.1 hypothetical protein [Halalkalibacterium halodurans]MED4126276.1 hypothetical protein [Halalkalibacterium halodurans]